MQYYYFRVKHERESLFRLKAKDENKAYNQALIICFSWKHEGIKTPFKSKIPEYDERVSFLKEKHSHALTETTKKDWEENGFHIEPNYETCLI